MGIELFDNMAKRIGSATYRPWFNSKAPTHPLYVKDWVEWKINQEKQTHSALLDAIWLILLNRIGTELLGKIKNPLTLKKELTDHVNSHQLFKDNVQMIKNINQANDDDLVEHAKTIHLKIYQLDLLKKYCLSLSRKQLIFKMESIKIKHELSIMEPKEFVGYFENFKEHFPEKTLESLNQTEWQSLKDMIYGSFEIDRKNKLTYADNTYVEQGSKRYQETLIEMIKNDKTCDFFGTEYVTFVANQLRYDDFQKLKQAFYTTDISGFRAVVLNSIAAENNIHCYWWYASLLFGFATGSLCAATLAGISEKGQNKLNPVFDEFWALEAQDPIFRGAGFGLFGVALVILWMLHPVENKPVTKRPTLTKV